MTAGEERILAQFDYHAPDAEQQVKCAEIRAACKAAATVIVERTKPCADQSAAIRLIREAMMTANSAVVATAPTHSGTGISFAQTAPPSVITGGDDPSAMPCALLEDTPRPPLVFPQAP
jgi:hypothetical protein